MIYRTLLIYFKSSSETQYNTVGRSFPIHSFVLSELWQLKDKYKIMLRILIASYRYCKI